MMAHVPVDNPWFRWPTPAKALRMVALDEHAAVGHDRADMNEAIPARPGQLRLRSLAFGRITSLDQARRWKGRSDSIVPVFAVDGIPVATGYGTVTLPIGPGPHVVTVQTQDSKEDCCSSVAVDGDKGACLDYVAPYHSWSAAPEVTDVSLHGRLGQVGILPDGWPSERDPGPWRAAVGAAVLALIVAAAVLAQFDGPSPVLIALGTGLPALAVGAITGSVLTRRRRIVVAAAEERNAAHLNTPPFPFGGQEDGPVWHGPDARPRLRNSSHALIVVRQELRQWSDPVPKTRRIVDTELIPQVTLSTPPPYLTIDERPLPSGWGTWTVEVPPGNRRLDASTAGARASQEVTVGPGARVEVVLSVWMERRWSAPDATATLLAETPELAFAVEHRDPGQA